MQNLRRLLYHYFENMTFKKIYLVDIKLKLLRLVDKKCSVQCNACWVTFYGDVLGDVFTFFSQSGNQIQNCHIYYFPAP